MGNVLETIVNSKRLPVLFVGSGISKRYLYNYPSWKELLEISFSKFDSDTFHYQKHLDECKRKNMSEFDTNVYMGTLIESEFNTAFFDRKIKLGIGNSKNPSWVKRGISPYKMFLADYFKKQRLNKKADLLDELESFKQLKNKVSAIITTNYDAFLEKYVFPDDYKVFVHQYELFSDDSYNIAEIYKIHGSISDAESIIITQNDYAQFKDTRKLIVAKMLTLFAESPIIFMGYSLTDEDVREIIEDFLSCLSKEQLLNIRKHFVFISYKAGEHKLVEIARTIVTKSGTEIPFFEIQTDNFKKVYEILGKITPGISPVKIRETRKVVKRIVDESMASSKAESVIVGIDDLDKLDYTNKPLAIAIGYRDNILSKYGYGKFDDKYIFEDIIFNNKNFDKQAMCFERLINIQSTRLMPVFKYVNGITIPKDSKLYSYIQSHNSEEKIISSNVRKELKNVTEYTKFDELINALEKEPVFRRQAMLVLKNANLLTANDLREACKFLFHRLPEEFTSQSHFKRCVMILDLKENK